MGVLTGYFSGPLYGLIWDGRDGWLSGFSSEETAASKGSSNDKGNQKRDDYVPGEAALDAVRTFSPVKNLIRVSELDGTILLFETDGQPSEAYPVWLVEVKEHHPDKIPTTMYFQVSALTGNVLDLLEEGLKTAGISLTMTRSEVLEVHGNPDKTRKEYDRKLKQTLRTDSYEGLEVIFDNKGRVITVTVSGAGFKGPREVRVGDSKRDVLKKLGKAQMSGPNSMVYIPVDNKSLRFSLRFDSEDRVSELSIGSGDGEIE